MNHRVAARVGLLALGWLAGCGEDRDSAPERVSLDQALRAPPIQGGCGDIFVYGTVGSDRRGFTVLFEEGLIDVAYREEGVERVFELPDPRVQATLVAGTALSRGWCTDVLYGPPFPEVRAAAEAVSGQIWITVAPADADPAPFYEPAYVDLEIRDARWVAADGTVLETPLLELNDVFVGWYAG